MDDDQGWTIVDRYENKTRENMPEDETITSFSDRLIDIAGLVIVNNDGGSGESVDGRIIYRIPFENPSNV